MLIRLSKRAAPDAAARYSVRYAINFGLVLSLLAMPMPSP